MSIRDTILQGGRFRGLMMIQQAQKEYNPAGNHIRCRVQQAVLRINYRLGFIPYKPSHS